MRDEWKRRDVATTRKQCCRFTYLPTYFHQNEWFHSPGERSNHVKLYCMIFLYVFTWTSEVNELIIEMYRQRDGQSVLRENGAFPLVQFIQKSKTPFTTFEQKC